MSASVDASPRILPATLHDLLDRGAPTTMIDVRSPAEFETAHIEGAVNVPLDLLRRHRDRIAPAVDGDAVLVCQTGPRADEALKLLAGRGTLRAQVLDGGMSAWQQLGMDATVGQRTWGLERQVRMAAGSLVLTGIVASLRLPRARFLSGAIGFGLVFSAATDTCAMGNVLARMPWNRGVGSPDVDTVVEQLHR